MMDLPIAISMELVWNFGYVLNIRTNLRIIKFFFIKIKHGEVKSAVAGDSHLLLY